MLSTRDPLQTQGHIQTENEGVGKEIPCKWKSKETWNNNTQTKQTKIKTAMRKEGHYIMIKGSIEEEDIQL